MLRERLEIAGEVANCLHELEDLLDNALACSARLNGLVPTGRLKINASPFIVQNAMERAAEVHINLTKARADVLATHQALSEVRTNVGLDPYAFGDLRPCPETARALSVVSDASAAA